MKHESKSFRRAVGLFGARALAAGAAVWVALSAGVASAAELTVNSTRVRPNATRSVVVTGSVDREATYGVTVMVELVARPGNIGSVTFTKVGGMKSTPGFGTMERGSVTVYSRASEPDEVRITQKRRADVDVVQVGDPWPGRGNFSSFDTDLSGSPMLNGAVDDNGTFVTANVSFRGALASFPVVASADAQGVWDVMLATSKGKSGWENIETTLVAGTVTVSPRACETNEECADGDRCTLDQCRSGVCKHITLNSAACADAPVGKKRKVSNSSRRAGSKSD